MTGEVTAPQAWLIYLVTVTFCGGIGILQYFSSPLDSFVPKQPAIDNSTFANIDEIFTYHFHLDVAVNFDDKSVSGSITHDMSALNPTDKVVFDIWSMDITAVEYMPTGSA